MVKLFKPSWVNHDGNPIFSVDVHPDGSRFATGGQGQGCGQVCIWNMSPVLRADEEKKDSIPKLFCQLTNHLACVNCVRWSHDGRFLASAGDDKTIIIWQIGRTISGPGSYGAAFGKANVEQWRTVACLKGHDGDILHVAWSPIGDEYIASCSVDTTVIVWSTRRWHERVAVLRGHQGFVKGVCWDPLGKYVATQSDDKTVRLWRTHDWQQECVISAPFEETGGTTHVLRLSWSPDGQYVVSAHAMNNGGPTAQIIERGGWRTVKDFVGHRRAVTVARFFPSILKSSTSTTTTGTGQQEQQDGKPISDMFNCLAIGSRDRSVSIWRNDRKRALCVVHDLFTHSVVDLAWNPLTQQLLACSSDGSLAVLDFSTQELGRAVSQEEQASLFQRLYGLEGAGQAGQLAGLALNNLLVENVDVLRAHEKAKSNGVVLPVGTSRPEVSQTTQSNASGMSSQRLAKGPTDRQIETILPDGRRRITPLYIPLDSVGPDGGPEGGLPLTFSSSRQEKSKIIVEKRDNSSCSLPLPSAPMATTPTVTTPQQQQQPTPTMDLNSYVPLGNEAQTQPAPSMPTPVTPQQLPQSTPSGAIASNAAVSGKGKPKRIRPTLVSVPSGEAPPLPASTTAITPQASGVPQDHVLQTVPSLSDETPAAQLLQQQRYGTTAASSHKVSSAMQVPAAGAGSATAAPAQIYPALQLRQPCVINIDTGLTVQIVTNIPVTGGSTISRVICTKLLTNVSAEGAPVTQELWDTVVEGRVCAAAASAHLTACVDSEGHLLLLCTRSGRRVAPPLVMSAPAAMLTCRSFRVAALCIDGMLSLYEVSKPHQDVSRSVSGLDTPTTECSGSMSLASLVYGNGSFCHKRVLSESVRPVLTANRTAVLRSLDLLQPNGLPLLAFSNGRHYVFDQTAESWCLVSWTSGVISRCSDHYATLPPDNSLMSSKGPLERIQGSLLRSTAGRTMSYLQANPSVQRSATLAFLESELNAARALSSPTEFRFWALALVRFLAAEGLETRLRLALDDIISADGLSGDATVSLAGGTSPRQMLEDVLPVIAANLRLQRVYLEYKQRLEILEESCVHGKLPRVTSLRARQASIIVAKPRTPPAPQGQPAAAVGTPENDTSVAAAAAAATASTGKQTSTTPVQARKRGRPPKNRGSAKHLRLDQTPQQQQREQEEQLQKHQESTPSASKTGHSTVGNTHAPPTSNGLSTAENNGCTSVGSDGAVGGGASEHAAQLGTARTDASEQPAVQVNGDSNTKDAADGDDPGMPPVVAFSSGHNANNNSSNNNNNDNNDADAAAAAATSGNNRNSNSTSLLNNAFGGVRDKLLSLSTATTPVMTRTAAVKSKASTGATECGGPSADVVRSDRLTGGSVGRVLQGVLKAIEREENEQRMSDDATITLTDSQQRNGS